MSLLYLHTWLITGETIWFQFGIEFFFRMLKVLIHFVLAFSVGIEKPNGILIPDPLHKICFSHVENSKGCVQSIHALRIRMHSGISLVALVSLVNQYGLTNRRKMHGILNTLEAIWQTIIRMCPQGCNIYKYVC